MATIVTTDKGGARYSLPPFPAGVSPDLAVAIERYRAGYADREGPDEWCASAAAIHEMQPRSLADVAAKLIVAIHYRDPTGSADAFAVDVPDASEDRRAVEMELSCLDTLLAQLPSADDVELRDAFGTTQRAFLELKAQPLDLSDAEADRFYARMDPADVVLRTVPAQTTAGVIMKLRRAFVGIVGQQWSDDAMRDDRPVSFEEALKLDDMPVEMLWRAIEDLERMSATPLGDVPKFRTSTHAWADAVAAYEQATAATVAIDGDRDEDAFDKAATAQGETIDALLDTPAPDMAALATKLRVIHRDGYQHRLAAVLADAERLADPRPDAGHADWLAERNTLIGRLDGDDLTEQEHSDGAGELNRLDNRIVETPAATATDVFAKLLLGMQLLTEGHHLIEGDAAHIVEEARRLTGLGRVSPSIAVLAGEARS